MTPQYKYSIQYGPLEFFGDTDEDIVRKITSYYLEKGVILDRSEVAPVVKKSKTEVMAPKSSERKDYSKAVARLTFDKILSGARAIIKNDLGLTVDQAEITRRSIICTNCPLLKETSGCKSCGAGAAISKWLKKSKEALFKLRPAFKIPNGIEDRYCGHCGCSLFIVLPSEMSNFNETDPEKRPLNCWLNPKSSNYVA